MLRDAGTVAVDIRNRYEVAIGSFAGAEDPGTAAFGEIPAWWTANRDRLAGRRIAMFCTGGIRCEKAGAYLTAHGATDVVQLSGGILSYLRDVPPADSLWRGGCFVFDDRVALGHGLRPTGHVLCHACRRPHPPEVVSDPAWEDGARCPACAVDRPDAGRDGFRERARQMTMAARRGGRHLGGGQGR